MQALRREEDGFVGTGGFIRRQSFLRAPHYALHRGFKAAIDPNGQVKMPTILPLQQKDSLQQNDVHVSKLKYVRVQCALRLVGTQGFKASASLGLQRQDKVAEHFFKPKAVLVEMFGGSVRVEPQLRRGRPVIRREASHAKSPTAQRRHNVSRQKTLAAPINAA